MTTFLDMLGKPSAATILADGYEGVLLYAGTPAAASGKDFSAAQYQEYFVHSLQILYVYELGTTDISGGAAAGAAHAADLLADLKAKDASLGYPCCAAVDEHVAAANLALAVDYQRGFYVALKQAGYFGPVGVYGFSEVTTAVHDASPGPIADWYWGCGSRSSQPAFINIYQSNTGTVTIGGVQADVDDVLIPVEEEVTNPFTANSAPAPILIPFGQANDGAYSGTDAAKPTSFSDYARFTNAVVWYNQNLLLNEVIPMLAAMEAAIATLQTGKVNPGPYYLTDVPPTA